MKEQRGSIVLIVLLVAAVIFGGYELIGWVAQALAKHVPDTTEVALFGDLGVKKGFRLTAKDDQEKLTAAIFKKLLKYPNLRELKYQLAFSDDTSPNAFAMPGGSISVTRGLLNLVEGEIGLAMVLAHEFGHQQKRHALTSMGRSLITAGLVMMVFGGDQGLLVGLAVDAAENGHSRDQEYEADRFGIDMVYKTYGRLDGAFEFFEDLEKDPQTKGSKMLSFVSTHPYTPDRINKLKQRAKQLQKTSAKPTTKG